MSLSWLKRSLAPPLCPLGIAKSGVGYKTLCLALFLTFHHSFIPQTFIEHLCVPGSVLGAGGYGGEWSLSSTALALHFPAMLRWFPYLNVLNAILSRALTPVYQFLYLSFPFSIQWAPFHFFQNLSLITPSMEISISLLTIIQLCMTWRKKKWVYWKTVGWKNRARAALGNLSKEI